MPEVAGHDVLHEWQSAMQALVAAAASTAAPRELPRQILAPMQRQLALIEEVLHRERALQRELVTRAFAPVDAVFDLLEQSGGALRQQAEALKESARALEQAASMIEVQAELFERAIHLLREPTDVARSLTGADRRPGERETRSR